jgi:hypothetical protein
MIMTRRNCFRHRASLLVVLALVAGACAAPPPQAAPRNASTPEPSPSFSPPTQTTASIPSTREHVLPSATVIDLATDARVDIASLTPAATPVLLWFWAPH